MSVEVSTAGRFPYCWEEVQTADFPAAQDGFHLEPYFPDQVEIGKIGRKGRK